MISSVRIFACHGIRLTNARNNSLLKAKKRFDAIRSENFANRQSAFRRTAQKKSLREILMEPPTETAYLIGKGALAGASAFGLGALCYYGIGLSNELGAVDRSVMWPEYVRRRIQATYSYFGASVLITAISAYNVSRSARIMRILTANPTTTMLGTLVLLIGSGIALQAMPYPDQFGAKQILWMAHSGLVGTIIAPLCFLGGPLLLRAACYTAGMVGSLSMLAACAPSEKFLHVGGPLAMGLGLVFVSSLGTFFFPPTTVLGAGLYSMSIYGGLVVFGGFLLYDTQRIIKMAEWSPEWSPAYGGKIFDPINASLSIYMDTINIFIRIVHILATGGNSGRRK